MYEAELKFLEGCVSVCVGRGSLQENSLCRRGGGEEEWIFSGTTHFCKERTLVRVLIMPVEEEGALHRHIADT